MHIATTRKKEGMREGKGRKGARWTIDGERQVILQVSFPRELFLSAKRSPQLETAQASTGTEDAGMCPRSKRKAAGTVDCFSFASAFSEVAGEPRRKQDKASQKNKQEEIRKKEENKACGTNQA